ncbi:23S rRNA (adenine-N6)-dimethyltransferase [Sinosporangium album]|uniref:23S rRNA (Adenine-N6)-dimethyltransferase n=1 Tax=Sinosporangium album TaxID=504805 RepID=A0A1G7Z2V4_9ACTN|nr:rRNA adenine N-6-methyltransferase family protein [Sinosporangium album]SDH02905.1 23S rRNA (adenine-N6)-dimethyltransferase [Sinosporangium album]
MGKSLAHGNYSHTQRQAKNRGGRTPRDLARRTLSQNFLVDRRAVRHMADMAGAHELVLEPGAGEGALTFALAARCSTVTAYEIDPLLAAPATVMAFVHPDAWLTLFEHLCP